jgi:intraflagellar transport protein 81
MGPQVRLAPQIKKLRVVRQQFAELESEHAGRKQQYDAAMSQYESRVSTLENEVRPDCQSNEQQPGMNHQACGHAFACTHAL